MRAADTARAALGILGAAVDALAALLGVGDAALIEFVLSKAAIQLQWATVVVVTALHGIVRTAGFVILRADAFARATGGASVVNANRMVRQPSGQTLAVVRTGPREIVPAANLRTIHRRGQALACAAHAAAADFRSFGAGVVADVRAPVVDLRGRVRAALEAVGGAVGPAHRAESARNGVIAAFFIVATSVAGVRRIRAVHAALVTVSFAGSPATNRAGPTGVERRLAHAIVATISIVRRIHSVAEVTAPVARAGACGVVVPGTRTITALRVAWTLGRIGALGATLPAWAPEISVAATPAGTGGNAGGTVRHSMETSRAATAVTAVSVTLRKTVRSCQARRPTLVRAGVRAGASPHRKPRCRKENREQTPVDNKFTPVHSTANMGRVILPAGHRLLPLLGGKARHIRYPGSARLRSSMVPTPSPWGRPCT